jgi:hypothetical protein
MILLNLGMHRARVDYLCRLAESRIPLQRHTALRTIARVTLFDLRMHWTGIDHSDAPRVVIKPGIPSTLAHIVQWLKSHGEKDAQLSARICLKGSGFNRADIPRALSIIPTAMQPENTGGSLPLEKSTLREKARKTAIVLLLLGSLVPPLATNIGLSAQNMKWSGPLPKLNRPFPSFSALMLCQIWTLFASISPFNYTINFQVRLTNGQDVALRDLQKEAAGKWESVLFHNEKKTWLNLYSDRNGMKQYMEYLIRTNALDPAWVTRRTIYLRYRAVLKRDEAAAAGAYYGPETISIIEDY